MITVYSADWCGYCKMVKNYFNSLGVTYEEKNVETDPASGAEAVEKSGQRGIPVIDLDGEIIIGFDKPKIDTALKDKKLLPIA